jgi:hypothetical protein
VRYVLGEIITVGANGMKSGGVPHNQLVNQTPKSVSLVTLFVGHNIGG